MFCQVGFAARSAVRIAAMTSASIALRWARILRMLWPQPQSTANKASPRVPLSGLRDTQENRRRYSRKLPDQVVQGELRNEAQALHAKIDLKTNEIGRDLVEVRSGRASFELLGVLIFVVGSVLSTASPEIASWAVGHDTALCR